MGMQTYNTATHALLALMVHIVLHKGIGYCAFSVGFNFLLFL
jgi:hypothetical protein